MAAMVDEAFAAGKVEKRGIAGLGAKFSFEGGAGEGGHQGAAGAACERVWRRAGEESICAQRRGSAKLPVRERWRRGARKRINLLGRFLFYLPRNDQPGRRNEPGRTKL